MCCTQGVNVGEVSALSVSVFVKVKSSENKTKHVSHVGAHDYVIHTHTCVPDLADIV